MSHKPELGQLRIIAGKWRHRRVTFPDVQGLRPTPDRVRETLFNWLQPYIEGATCLDLFTGSGALGVEALSRGAGHVVMLEQDPRAIGHLRGQLEALGATADEARVIQADALSYLRGPAETFDVVFVDPPFHTSLIEDSCRLLDQGPWLAPNARIYLEMAWTPAAPALPARWRLLHHKRAGDVGYALACVSN
ncbi:MAG TPA: 16S rRNA (guanine(966)-N(2))-methyltransferase RsmD [Gammaproteobacteria bacterium]|nr:16S rRNA (guanine(966)-N(2))-methyltransferase RsmD [Gammaproteobacteria bacterium]